MTTGSGTEEGVPAARCQTRAVASQRAHSGAAPHVPRWQVARPRRYDRYVVFKKAGDPEGEIVQHATPAARSTSHTSALECHVLGGGDRVAGQMPRGALGGERQ
jgi:hypothetical protein